MRREQTLPGSPAGLFERLPYDRIVLRPIPERFEEQAPAPPPAPDSAVADRFIAAHASRYCTPGQAGSKTCRSLASPRPVRRVIVHVVAVPSTSKRTGVEAVIAGWQRKGREAGAHYLVDRDGTVTQMIREDNAAFHTPGNNADSIGIEHADVCNDPAPLTTQLYERSAALVRDIASRHGFAITDTSVSGHRDVNPNHGDPGPYWDWEYYRLLLAWDGTTAASRPVRAVTSAAAAGTAPSGWKEAERRSIKNSYCAKRRDPWGSTYWKAKPSATGVAAELTLTAPEAGTYSVSLWWPDVKGANPAVTVEVGTTAIQINQRQDFGRWNAVGTVTVAAGAEVKVRIRRDSAQSGWILCDGVRLLRGGATAPATEDFAEQLPPGAQLIPVGLGAARDLTGGAPPNVRSTWFTLDPRLARVAPDPANSNRVTVFGLAPGQTTLRQLIPISTGGIQTVDTPLVVSRMQISLLGPDEPAAPLPEPNELVRPTARVANPVAERAVLVQLEPANLFAGETIDWVFVPAPGMRGALPAGRSTLEAEGAFQFAPNAGGLTGRSLADAQGRVAVQVNLPSRAFNRGRIVASVQGRPWVSAAADLEVPGIVVVDPGHGGSVTIGGSSPNNATGVVSGAREKNVTLALGLKVRDALAANQRLVRVTLTRDCDIEVGINQRAALAKCRGADILVSIHFNAGPAARHGTSTYVRANANGNVNRNEDVALARRIQDRVVAAIPGGSNVGGGDGIFDDTHSQHGVLGVLNDATQGNTAALHPLRSCLLEVEYFSNEAMDRAFNLAANRETLRTNVANAIAAGIVDDLANQ